MGNVLESIGHFFEIALENGFAGKVIEYIRSPGWMLLAVRVNRAREWFYGELL